MIAPTQLINVQRGKYEVSIDLSSQQALGLKGNKNVDTLTTPSTWVFWLFANNDPQDLELRVEQELPAGRPLRARLQARSPASPARARSRLRGSSRRCSSARCPQSAAVKQNVTKAKAFFAASGVANQKITLEYPSNFTINGVLFDSLAQKVQANLQDAGLNVELAGAPVGTWLQRYRDGKMPFGLSLWGPDYPDPSDYLAFLPGELVGTRAGWPAGSQRRRSRLSGRRCA